MSHFTVYDGGNKQPAPPRNPRIRFHSELTVQRMSALFSDARLYAIAPRDVECQSW